MEGFKFNDEVTDRAVDAVKRGAGGGLPLYEAARGIVDEEEIRRQEMLAQIAEGQAVELDPELFPPDVFNLDGSRITDEGRARLTDTELRAYDELEDSRRSF